MSKDYKEAKGLRRYTGLMFRTKKTKPLLFKFCKPTNQSIHSFFVFFPFRAIWFDEYGSEIEDRIIRPFSLSVSPSKPYAVLLEIPQ